MVTTSFFVAVAIAAAVQLDGPDEDAPGATPPDATAETLPDASSSSRPTSAPADMRLQLGGCMNFLKEGRPGAAAVCYREIERQALTPDDVAVAAALADLAVAMSHRRVADARAEEQRRRGRGTVVSAGRYEDPLLDFITSGKLELVLASGAYGLWVGGWTGGLSGNAGAVMPLALGTGLAGLTAAVLGVNFFSDLSSGDANLLRSSMVFGVFNSVSALVLLSGWAQWSGMWQLSSGALMPMTVLGVSLGSVGAAAGVAALTDIPGGNVALALSGGFWGAILTALTLATIGSGLDFYMAFGTVTVVADLAYLGLLAAAPALPVTRIETWFLDGGALCGLVAGGVLAVGSASRLGQATPLAVVATTVVGGSAGFLAGRALRTQFKGWGMLDAAPEAGVWPWLQPGVRPEATIMGAGLRFAL